MIEITLFLLSILILRNCLVYGLTYFFLKKEGKKRIIFASPFKEGQLIREAYKPLIGTIVDTILLLLLIVFKGLVLVAFSWHGFMLSLVIFVIVHVIIVEPLYYWYHRLLHKKPFYKDHHLLHHRSVTTNPNTGFSFTLAERFSYSLLFVIPILAASIFNVLCIPSLFLYLLVFDLVNAIGHFNYEYFPQWYIKSKLRFFIYSASFHALHHKHFHTNFSLFMPIFDLWFKTYDKDSEITFLAAIDEPLINALQKATEP